MASPQPKRIFVGILLGLIAGIILMLIEHLVEGIEPPDRFRAFFIFETVGTIAGAIIGTVWALTATFDQEPPDNPRGHSAEPPADSS